MARSRTYSEIAFDPFWPILLLPVLIPYSVLDNIGLIIEDRLGVRLASLGVCLLLAAVSWRFV